MMATTAFVREYHAFASFERKTPPTQYTNLHHFNNEDNLKMAPFQQDILQKNLENTPIIRSLENRETSMSSPGTSAESYSSDIHPNEEIEDMNSMVVNLSSDESNALNNGYRNRHENHDGLQNPLKQLQTVLENGILGQSMFHPVMNGTEPKSDDSYMELEESYEFNDPNIVPKCHFCGHAAESREEYNAHINGHFQFNCPECPYKARTEGRLKNHMKFHQETNPESWAVTKKRAMNDSGGHIMDDSGPGGNTRKRITKCKHCKFVGNSKSEYYAHLKECHTELAKLLHCNQCDFITEFKHHLEYHLRNHVGSKPYKCDKCNYSCVNQSMLNSHLKSHSNIYQYRCASCSYATKYCHSLKMHLRKYSHKPGPVLNSDGTPDSSSVIDVHGRRRGPKSKKKRMSHAQMNASAIATISPSPPSANYLSSPSLNTNPAIIYNPQIYNNFSSGMFMRPSVLNNSGCFMFPPTPYVRNEMLRSYYDSKHHSPSRSLMYDNYATKTELDSPRHEEINNYQISETAVTNADVAEQDRRKLQSQNTLINKYPFINYDASPVAHQSELSQESKQAEKTDNVHQRSDYTLQTTRDQHTDFSSCPGSNKQELVDESKNGGIKEEESAESAPLDLTRNSPVLKPETDKSMNIHEAMKRNESIDQVTNSSNQRREGASLQAPRNRRKGRAFKLDQYMHYEDQPFDFSNQLHCLENSVRRPLPETANQKCVTSFESEVCQETALVNHKSIDSQLKTSDELSFAKKMKTHTQTSPKSYVESNVSIPAKPSNDLHRNDIQASSVAKDIPPYHQTNGGSSPLAGGSSPKAEVSSVNGATITNPYEKYRCPHCDIGFGDFVMLALHMSTHSMGNPFTCAKCGEDCKNKVGFHDHMINYCSRRWTIA